MILKIKEKKIFIFLGVIIYMCLGSVYSWSIFRKPLENILNISSTESSLPYMTFLIFYALSMPVAGNFIKKYGPRNITLFGGIIVSLGWFLSSFATSIEMLTITYGVIGGIGVGIVYGAPMAVSARWFPNKKGLAVGLTLSGFGLSPFITAPISRLLIEHFGVFSSFKILSVAFFIIILIFALPLRFPDEEEKTKENISDTKENSLDLPLMKVLKNRNFYILWVCFAIGTFTGLMAIGISSPVAQEIVGLSPTMSAFSVALFAIFNGIGRPVFGMITDKIKFKQTAIISFGLIILASTIMLNSGEGNIMFYIISFSMFWFILGGWLAIAPTAVANSFGAKNYARNYGFLFTAYGVGAVVSSITSGIIKDVFGSYIYVFYPTIGSAIIGILILVLWIKK
jgi:OFA family oxalate/formate antiporter-like MFS transporter